ncbi:uncharacterized protein P174DRAFT_387884 [Aspergillus novofumigatus IBT 16806]|uniref:Uncharacterized protein n=1 Tax=Aspergillus novofumigatus (strain IBT 16806) TaxID=1392255 RepID=A0A2I1CEF0_ASPN1|nr:uncharacterized protein P174DRAFT_387884 [Aspergillus novofumigatus IBT 16806]PKX96017.1 hypothetical protein P174DRAFT_387884 [Aspergillus novofumigatus IBT 16806]
MGCKPLTFVLLSIPLTSAHLAAFTEGMYCPEGSYQGALTNATDPNLHIFDPLYQLSGDDWFLSKGKNCWLAEPTGIWEITANSVVSAGWTTRQNCTGFYGSCVLEDAYPTPYSVTNPAVIAAGLVTSSHGLAKPNLHCANKSTAAGTALAVAYKSSIWEVTMEDFVVVSIAANTPFELLANYSIPDLAPCAECLCATGWVPLGYGQGNMYQTPHKCKIINPSGGQKPKVPSLPPGPGVQGPKQLIAFFQAEGNNVAALPGNRPPTYSTDMGFTHGAQTDIF